MKYLLVILFVCSSFFSCKTTSQDSSAIKHGHLKHASEAWLVNIKPSQELTFCGAKPELMRMVIMKWAKPIMRDKLINFTTTCNPYADHTVWVYMLGGKGDEIAREECAKYDFNFSKTSRREIYLCVARPSGWEGVLTHEAGHLWGLCDQYKPRPGHTSNCDERNKTPQMIEDSIMARSALIDLRKDDVLGITAAALRVDVPANRNWKNVVQLDKSNTFKVQADSCNNCSEQIEGKRYCGIIAPNFKRWISGRWIPCNDQGDLRSDCQSPCGKQRADLRYCGIKDIQKNKWVEGDWVECVGP